jgi:hypothetical protein
MPNPNPSPATRFRPGAEWRGVTQYGPRQPLTPERQAKLDRVKARRRDALRLREAGAGYDEIARLLHCSRATAMHHVQRALKDAQKDPAELLLKLELSRLDRQQRNVWSRALAGDLAAADRCLQIMARRAKLLGLDMPSRHEVHERGAAAGGPGPVITLEEIDAWAEMWLSRRRLESADGPGEAPGIAQEPSAGQPG